MLPEIRPTKFLSEDKSGAQVWAVIDAKGCGVCTVVRYLRVYPSHFSVFEKHVELLLKEDSVHVIKFAGAYATDSSVCVVLQPLAGATILSLVDMKQCGPLPESFLSVVVRSLLRALQALSSAGHVPETLSASHLWLAAESVKLGTTYHFDWQPSNEARELSMQFSISSLPDIITRIAGIPRERMQADGTEEMWAPGGFFPDAKYGELAASMWPLRFGKLTDDRVRSFMEACANPDSTIELLMQHDLVAAYSHMALDVVNQWFQVQGEYERFKYARGFVAMRIFASTAAKHKKADKEKQEADARAAAADAAPENTASVLLNDPNNSVGVGISPEGSGALGEDLSLEGKKVTIGSPEKKHTIQEIASKADDMPDDQLIQHLYNLFQDSQRQGGNEGLFKGLRGLESFTLADFGKVCREFHILEKYRGAMTRTLGSSKQLRAKREPVFIFKKPTKIAVGDAEGDVEPTPMSDTAKKVVQVKILQKSVL